MEPLNLDPEVSILIYGDTGEGKTSQIGELAEHVYFTTGKKTVLFQADRGGMQPIKPYIRAGIIKEVIHPSGDFHVWLAHAAQGEKEVPGVRDPAKGWESVLTDDVGLLAHEGITAYCDLMLMAIAGETARGRGPGGEDTFVLKVDERGTKLAISNNNRVHYMLAQREVQDLLYRRQIKVPTIWTALVRRDDEDKKSRDAVLGPHFAGKALTTGGPRLFDYAWRIQAVVNGPQVVRSLHLDMHKDQQAVGAKGLANSRVPLLGADVKVPTVITPASIVKALQAIGAAQRAADEKLAARMNQKEQTQ